MAPGSEFEAELQRLRQLLVGSQPAEVSEYLAVLQQGQAYLRGSTVTSLEMQTILTASGLHVPATAQLGPNPIDLLKTYVTASEAFGGDIGLPHVLGWLHEADRESVLRDVAGLLAERQAIGARWNELDRALVARMIRPEAVEKILNVMGHDRPLVSPQGLLILAKFALQRSPVGGNTDMSMLVPAVLAVQEDLESRDEAEPEDGADRLSPGGRLFREILRSHMFYSQTHEGVLTSQFALRWHDIPEAMAPERGAVNLSAVFAEATGVSLDDFWTIGVAIWARALQLPGVPIPLSYFSTLRWTSQRLEGVLGLITRDASHLAEQLVASEREFGFQWSFDPLRRFPVVRLDGDRLLLLSPRLMFERIAGWLPIFDVVAGLEALGQQRRAKQVEAFFRGISEREAMDSLAAIAGGGPVQRLYSEADLQGAFGSGKTADAALDYGSTWIVVEISSRRLTRASAVGGSRTDLETDLDRGVYQKVEQLEATIQKLAADESRLTGVAPVAGRRYIPLLITTEGFPTNPMTTAAIEAELAAAGILAGPRVAPIRIIDQEELYSIEAIVEDGAAGLLDLLEGYSAGRLRGMGFKDWASAERGLALARPERLAGAFKRAWAVVLEALGETGGIDNERGSEE